MYDGNAKGCEQIFPFNIAFLKVWFGDSNE